MQGKNTHGGTKALYGLALSNGVRRDIYASSFKNNNKTKMNFYKGKTLYQLLTNVKTKQKKLNSGASLVKFVNNSSGIRTYYLENIDVTYKKGDKLKNAYTNETSEIAKIFHNYKSIESQDYLRNTSIQLKTDISINRGDTIVPVGKTPIISDTFKSKIIWTGDNKLLKSKSYLFKFHPKSITGFISKTDMPNIIKNSKSIIQIELEEKVHISEINSNYYFSQLVIIDPDDNSTVGFGYNSKS